jgi:hypothetical protein
VKKNLCCILALLCIGSLKTIAQESFGGFISCPSSISTYSSFQYSPFSFDNNQAMLGNVQHFMAGISSERRFMINELGYYHLTASIPVPAGAFAVNLHYSGSTGMNESLAGIAYGRKVAGGLRVGIQMNWYSIKLPAVYGKTSILSFDAGLLTRLTDKLQAGVHTRNPLRQKFGVNKDELLPALYSFGVGYDASEKFYIGLQLEKEESTRAVFQSGFIYRPVHKLIIATGFSSSIPVYYIMIGFCWKQFRFDISATSHPQLGFTPATAFMFEAGNHQ